MRRASPSRILTAALLALLCALQLLALLRAPDAWMPDRITVTLARGQSTTLGRTELAAPQADERQVRLRRDAGGAWWVANANPAAPLLLVDAAPGSRAARTGSIVLAAGRSFRLGAAAFTVTAANEEGVLLSGAGAQWRYDGALLRRAGAPQDACPDSRPGARLAAAWNRIAPPALAMARPLVFGGNLDCGNRIAIAGLPAPAATVVRTPGGFVLAAGAAPLLLDDGTLLAGREERLDGKATLVAGRTRLAIEPNGDLLHLRPVAHVALQALPQQRLPEGVAWTWTRRAAWTLPPAALPAGLACVALAALAGLATVMRRGAAASPWRTAGAVLLLGAGVALLVLQRLGQGPGPGIALVAAWAALWFLLLAAAGPRPALAPCAAILLLAVGLLAQLDLGLGAAESSWLRHFQKSAAVLALGAGAIVLVRDRAPRARLAQPRAEALLLLLAALALGALLLQVAFGDETGVFDLQPVEFAKLALAALTAHCLALESGAPAARHTQRRRWLLSLAPSLLFMALLGVALVQVDDYSPLVLLAVWGGALALAHALATGRRLLAGGLAAGALGVALAVAALHGTEPAQLAKWHFYGDRFLVWLDPGTHPHTGEQLLRGARAIAAGGWWGADGAAGLSTLGRDAGVALRVPAVQDDFAASFFLQRHGLAGGLALWGLQVLFVGGLLSWGTNLAILPIMGQPMSFLSAGGSHLMFFICPLLGLAVATSQPLSENDDAGLRPT